MQCVGAELWSKGFVCDHIRVIALKGGLCTHNIVTWGLVRHTDSQAPPRCWLRNSGMGMN